MTLKHKKDSHQSHQVIVSLLFLIIFAENSETTNNFPSPVKRLIISGVILHNFVLIHVNDMQLASISQSQRLIGGMLRYPYEHTTE